MSQSLGSLITKHRRMRKPIHARLLKSIARQICTGLSHLHAKGLAHRDLVSKNIKQCSVIFNVKFQKPDNILVDLSSDGQDAEVALCDLGANTQKRHVASSTK
eukprot:GHVQ01007626.1.p1 GENE.GHVQ01007626.1~~GHVQ01007626.1.p1  ORF type:complete len:103 (-),score=2.57 GHVQ01007626.1:723-1031(-)